MSILEVRNLSVQYHTGQESRQALDGISFSVGEGETVGIVGESGSGKSTAMLAVMGLLGDSAEVSSDGITVCADPVQPGRDIAMILQDSLNCLNPAVKIGRQITETAQGGRQRSGRKSCWIWQGSAHRSFGWGSIRLNYPEGCAREWPSPLPLPASPG